MRQKKLALRGLVIVCGLVLVAASLALVVSHNSPDVKAAADVTEFNPGNIISDGVFFNAGAMSVSDISAFIQSKELSCQPGSDGSPCLKNFTQTTAAKSADANCDGYSPAANEPAAVIIAKVATSCGINPEVLLVIMQKEEGLVTGSGSALSAGRYRIAMGYGCPDTAACDTTYYGFQNQVYSAAWQYRQYAASPDTYGYHAGRTSNILWNPNTACGSAPVYVANQATAGLYNYTPYQPNGAALAAGYGNGDSCSAYGNRNFWLYFTDWFGSTQGGGQSAWNPVGSFDTPTVQGRVAQIAGWAADPDNLNGVTTVHVYVDGVGVAILQADQTRSDITGAHGYVTELPLVAGTHNVCTYGINSGRGDGSTQLGCHQVVINASPGDLPFGVQGAAASGRNVVVYGWAVDPNAPSSPLTVHVYADGNGVAILQADQTGMSLDPYLPGSGSAHSYTASLALGAGPHTVCAYGINTGAGSTNTLLGCYGVVVDKAAFNPIGSWESMTRSGGSIQVSGWAEDLDTTGANDVHVYVDGVGVAVLTADLPSSTVTGHGFQGTVKVGVGTHNVCLYNINVGEGTGNILLGCRSVTVTAADFNPTGSLTSVSAVGGTVSVSGYATDPDTTGPILVPVYVDGRGIAVLTADQPNGTADGHGYTATLLLDQGTHNVCTYGSNVGVGTTNVLLGCKPVTVTPNPVGSFDPVVADGGRVTVTGYATDPDTTGSILVPVYVDGQGLAVLTANQPNATADGHGYTGTLTLADGPHTICTYGSNVGPGGNSLLGCRQITVSSNPSGSLDPVIAIGGKVSVSGYAVDPDSTGAIRVAVYVDGQGLAVLTAGQPNAVLNGHGYTATLTLPPGPHTVCTYGLNVGAGTTNVLLGCQAIVVSSNPSGTLDSATVSGGQLSLSGWAADPDTAGPILVPVYVDGQGLAVLTADQPNTVENGHGYAASLTVAPGRHTVCTYGSNVGAGTTNVLLGCRSVSAG